MAERCKFCALLILSLITCFQIVLFTEGRLIKSTNKQELVSIEKDSLKEMGRRSMATNLNPSTAENQKVSLPTPPNHISSVHQSKEGRKELVPSFSDSAAVYKDDFRPTAPGFTPSTVGNPKTPETISNNEHSVTAFKDEHSVTAFKDDFQPTTPGHSPGVGHILADDDDSEDVGPKTPGTGSSIERSGAAFQPTPPGHSPGAGHPFTQNDSEDVDPKAPANSSSVEHSVSAFKPTTPGHSPGIGHVSSVDQSEKSAVSKTPSIEHSVTGVPDDFRPTVPGHSPGIGHGFQTQMKN